MILILEIHKLTYPGVGCPVETRGKNKYFTVKKLKLNIRIYTNKNIQQTA